MSKVYDRLISGNYVFITSDLYSRDLYSSNAIAIRKELKDTIYKLGYSILYTVLGKYESNTEWSYCVPITTSKDVGVLLKLAKDYHQESILHLSYGMGTLCYTSEGITERIGILKERDFAYTRNVKAYSRINGKYYVVE